MPSAFDVQPSLENRYRARGVLFADTALRVGTKLAAASMTDNPIVRDAWGRPFLPGSTLKGAVRMAVERLVPTLNLPGVRSCGMAAGSRIDCVSVQEGRRREAQELADGALAEFLSEHTCTTCRLFGSPVQAGRVFFADLAAEPGWDAPAELRDGAPIDRDTERAYERRRFDYEVVAAGTPFRCEIAAENLSDAELGLLALGVLELVHGHVVLGGGKSRGLGRCHLELEAVERVRFAPEFRAEILAYVRDGSMADVGPAAPFLAERVDALVSA